MALYVSGVVWLPALKHTLVALAPVVIVGKAPTVRVARPSEVRAGGIQVPVTLQRYLKPFIPTGGLVIVRVVVVTFE